MKMKKVENMPGDIVEGGAEQNAKWCGAECQMVRVGHWCCEGVVSLYG